MDWYCSNCFGEGSISHYLTEKPLCVICENCSNIDAYVWCEKCGMGGQISTTNFNDRPAQWVCGHCGKKYDLPPGFYEHCVTFTPIAFSARYSHISPLWLQRAILFWDSQRVKIWIAWLCLFFVSIGFGVVFEKRCTPEYFSLFHCQFLTYLSKCLLVIMIGMAVLFATDVITWSVNKFFRLRRRLQKKNYQ